MFEHFKYYKKSKKRTYNLEIMTCLETAIVYIYISSYIVKILRLWLFFSKLQQKQMLWITGVA